MNEAARILAVRDRVLRELPKVGLRIPGAPWMIVTFPARMAAHHAQSLPRPGEAANAPIEIFGDAA